MAASPPRTDRTTRTRKRRRLPEIPGPLLPTPGLPNWTRLAPTDIPETLARVFPPDTLRHFSKESGVIERDRKVDPVALFWVLVLGFGVGLQHELEQLRRAYRDFTSTQLAYSSFYERFTPEMVQFLRLCLAHGLSQLRQEPGSTLDEQIPGEFTVHVVLDNLSAHKTEEVERWLRRHPRFHFHFTPTSSSWVNMVESWLSQLEKKALARGSFRSVPELKQAIVDYVATSNGRAEPWVWTKDAQEILRKIRKLRDRLRPTPTMDPTKGRIEAYPSATLH